MGAMKRAAANAFTPPVVPEFDGRCGRSILLDDATPDERAEIEYDLWLDQMFGDAADGDSLGLDVLFGGETVVDAEVASFSNVVNADAIDVAPIDLDRRAEEIDLEMAFADAMSDADYRENDVRR